MKTSALIALCAALMVAACENPNAAPPSQEPTAPAPYVPVTPLPASTRLNWERLDTINNCHIYVLAYGDRTYLLATSLASNGSSGRNVACALAPAGQ